MRIISGKYKGKQIRPPGNLPVRPTTDFAKTGLFNILENRYNLSGFECLDLFSGTGNISLELISRGCKHVTAVDKESHCTRFLKSIGTQLAISNMEVHRSDVILYLKHTPLKFDLIFADPPFDLKLHQELHHLIMEKKLIKDQGVFVLEHISRDNYDHLEFFTFKRKYGNITFSFFSNTESLNNELNPVT